MSDAQHLVHELVAQVRELLETRSVLGQPVVIGDATILPVASYGFGFGGGSGGGTSADEKETGSGGGAGAGGGIKPVALVIVDADGTRVEHVRVGGASLVETIAGSVERIADKQKDQSKET